ncbi:MAG: flagellar hook-length control protein FliK [Pseudomonadota bacterium]
MALAAPDMAAGRRLAHDLSAAPRPHPAAAAAAAPQEAVLPSAMLHPTLRTVTAAPVLSEAGAVTFGETTSSPSLSMSAAGPSETSPATPRTLSASPATTMPAMTMRAKEAPLARPLNKGGLSLTLQPAELGRLEIGVDLADDRLRLTIAAERASTVDLMRRHDTALQQLLGEAGFDAPDVSIELGHRHDQHPDADTPEGPVQAMAYPNDAMAAGAGLAARDPLALLDLRL